MGALCVVRVCGDGVRAWVHGCGRSCARLRVRARVRVCTCVYVCARGLASRVLSVCYILYLQVHLDVLQGLALSEVVVVLVLEEARAHATHERLSEAVLHVEGRHAPRGDLHEGWVSGRVGAWVE